MLKKVLVIDDSSTIHQMYKMVLMRYKCAITHAQNGREALDRLLKEQDYDLMFLDINMPVMNGLEFLKSVKDAGAFDHIPIVLVSTEGREENVRQGLSLGANGYIKKPFQPSELHALIDRLLTQRG